MTPPGDVRVDVQGLRIVLAGGSADVVDDVSFQVRSGELLGLVGESGSGKTTVALALLATSVAASRWRPGAYWSGTTTW